MGQRSRKRRRPAAGTGRRAASEAAPAPSRLAERRPAAEAEIEPAAEPAVTEQDRMAARYARGRLKDEQARAALVPLREGERPTAVTVAAIVAVALPLANVAAYAAGARVGDSDNAAGLAIFSAIMFTAAFGMWRARYWAVLGFQVLLGITILVAGLSLAVASNLAAVVLCVVLLVAAGTLFWKLIRAMARMQMPEPPSGERKPPSSDPAA